MATHGKSDWGLQLKSIVFSFDDLGELAARLKSIVTYDRRGDVILADDFENGFASWAEAPVGDVSDAILSAVTNRMGGYSLKLIAGTADEDEIIVARGIQPLVAGKVGLEVSFSKDTPYSYIYIEMYLYDGSKIWYVRIRYDSELHDLAYYNSTPGWTDIDTDVRLYEDIKCFHTIKVVADFNTNKYVRVLVNQIEHDISTADLYSDDALDLKHLAFGVTLEKNGAGTATSYIDSVILTQNEP